MLLLAVCDDMPIECAELAKYLVKPLQPEQLRHVLKKAIQKIQAAPAADCLLVSVDRQVKRLLLKDILYMESTGRIVRIHCQEGTLETYEQIGVLEQKLSGKFFFRCHKCFLVNLDYIDTFQKAEIRLENGERLLLAKRRYEDFQNTFLSYVKQKGGIV